MAALFAFHGAPDLALTQVLVESVTIIAFVLVLRRLPARLGEAHRSARRMFRAAVGVAFGAMMAAVAVVALGARTALPISLELPELAVAGGHGINVVNVILVDIRGWDTMGELSVIIVAATGVASLVFLRSRTDDLPRVGAGRRRTIRSRVLPVIEPVVTVVRPDVEVAVDPQSLAARRPETGPGEQVDPARGHGAAAVPLGHRPVGVHVVRRT